jgi:uncharacterized NAD(P)/FAD-binding protein YdhS
MRTIAIVGAGFCGTLAAVHLLRHPPPGPTRIVLLNRSGAMARGVAYGTRSERHVLNVPAGRMGAFPGAEDDFLRYLRRRDPRISGAAFVPRHEYGAYLETLLKEAEENASPECRLDTVIGEATHLERRVDGTGILHMAGTAEPIVAHRIVLALGNYLPAHPLLENGDSDFLASHRYIRDPWSPAAVTGGDDPQPILLIGTGLTALDVISDLRRSQPQCRMIALSRRALLPQSHRSLDSPPVLDLQSAFALLGAPTLRARTRLLRDWIARTEATGGDWRDVIAALRPVTPALWRSTAAADRTRFLRHLKAFWEIHRHRCAPELARDLQALRDSGQLRIVAGRLLRLAEEGDGATATYRPRGTSAIATLKVGTVINCTGPAQGLRKLGEPLLTHLLESGLIQSDPHELGLRVAENYALIDAQGRASPWLFYVGPFLRAEFWEATAVPELREHVARAMQVVRASLSPVS